jgi:AraC-like DNA-binding protein
VPWPPQREAYDERGHNLPLEFSDTVSTAGHHSVMSLSVVLVHPLVEAVESMGVSREKLLAAARFDPRRLHDSDGRMEHEEYNRLQILALDLSKDDALGLHMGERSSMVGLDVLAHLAAHAPNMRDAIGNLLRFHRIVSDEPQPVLEESCEVATLKYEVPRSAERCDRLRAELAMVGFHRLVGHFAGREQMIRRVFFEHQAPAYCAEYQRVFGGAERFGHDFTGIQFERALLDRQQQPLRSELYAALESLAERRLSRITRESRHAERLKEYLFAHPPSDWPDMETIARRFDMSVRSLRRRLEEEGVSFAGLLDDVRATVAKRMLDEPRRSIYETAYAMGFSDPSAFHRAFKRWTGMTPAQYRTTI